MTDVIHGSALYYSEQVFTVYEKWATCECLSEDHAREMGVVCVWLIINIIQYNTPNFSPIDLNEEVKKLT